MDDQNKNFMAWNSPGQSNGGNDREPQRDQDPWGRQKQDNDPWGRQRRTKKDFDFTKLFNSLKQMFGGKKGTSGWGQQGSGNGRRGSSVVVTFAIVVALGLYIFSGFYTVREAERGVVLRFGKVYDVVEPGLRWKFTGIDDVSMVDIEQVRAIQSSGTMLTEDENVVLVEMDVQYRISDPVQYLYSVTDPDNSLTEATDSALRYVVGHTLMDDILTSGREMVRQNTRDLLVSIIEPYNMGLTVVDVNFLPARAPEQVKEAFDDAIAAQEDEQRYKREAEAYANEVLPRAEGQVQRILQEAEAYRTQVVLDAQGEVARFEQILPEYRAAPEITRTRLYLETMQEVLGKSRKVIVDTKDGKAPLMYLPLPPLQATAAPTQNKLSSSATTSVPQVNQVPVVRTNSGNNQSSYSQTQTTPAQTLVRRDGRVYGSR